MSGQISYSINKLLLAYACWVAFWTLVQGVVLHRLGIGWETSFIDAATSNILLAIFCFVSITINRFYQPGNSNRLYRFIYVLLTCTFYCFILESLLGCILTNDVGFIAFLEKSMPIRFFFALLIVSFVTLLSWMWNTLKDQKEREDRKNEVEQLVKEAELVRLRQQLQPHFLFNSLNSISALAGSRPNEARKMIQQLSDFLRGTLKKDEEKVVPLKEELQHLKLYLEIEKVRFGDRLNVEYKVDEKVLNSLIPPLLLQPIVENAIKFGLYGTIETVLINIEVRFEESYLFVEIKNPSDPETQGSSKGTGFGLDSIKRRLFLLYGRNDLLTTEKKENKFITRLKIPQPNIQ